MINVKEITKENKKFLIEQLKLYKRFVELNSSMKLISDQIDNSVIAELNKLGLIDNEEELGMLISILGEDFVNEFIISVNRKIIEHIEDPFLERLYKREKEKKIEGPTLVDLFCGAGGLSLGFVKNNVNVLLANDINPTCIETYKFNHPNVSDKQVVMEDLKKIVDNIDEYLDITIDLDFLVGGPPCQGFSSANKRRIIDDPRNELYKYFIKAVDKLVPKFVVMENVKGMLSVADQVVTDYGNINPQKNGKVFHYETAYAVLTSNKFSVAQKRERLIYISVRSDIIEKFNVTPQDIIKKLENTEKTEFTLNDAIFDLPSISAEFRRNRNDIDSPESGYKIILDSTEETAYKKLINSNKIKYLFNHKARFLNANNFEIYSRMKQGDDGTAEQIQDIYRYSHRNNKFKDRYFRLYADRPSRTITAHLKMDGHSHIHPFQNRSITPREAARLQSFPDDYLFLGSYLETFMQIGNAVPPLLSEAISNELLKYIEV
ncbi:DNA cytosine methyltransferase [Streptococcus infantarius]|uniref:DNA cytosine methyltransferase n=1 Tax=Streptococcus infantarius TaxID=102684 RepID=UPI003D115FCF